MKMEMLDSVKLLASCDDDFVMMVMVTSTVQTPMPECHRGLYCSG